MVWFQCDDCGESVKKPKLGGHFGRCSAASLSCIDCGRVFSRASVKDHTSCISEAEKYGPKGDKAAPHSAAKPSSGGGGVGGGGANRSAVQMGLSTSVPWRCSICNVTATSQESLLGHAAGKKHINKARAIQRQAEAASPASAAAAPAAATTAASRSPDTAAAAVALAQENGHTAAAHSGHAASGRPAIDRAGDGHPGNGHAGNGQGMRKRSHEKAGGGAGAGAGAGVKRKRQDACQPEEGAAEDMQQERGGDGGANSGSGSGADGESAAAAGAANLPWKKLIRKELKRAGEEGTRTKLLGKAVVAQAQEQALARGLQCTRGQLLRLFREKLESAPDRFLVDGKRVRLA